MEVITIDFSTQLCGTCHHWQGARQNERGVWIRCMRQGDGLCQSPQTGKLSVLDSIKKCVDGENCANWMKWDVPPTAGSLGKVG
ncbi:MAG: hypothetical protein KGZ83_00190 [Sulfuricella sp.]|nr:hypothetical protein [Sulfuricella sp.]